MNGHDLKLYRGHDLFKCENCGLVFYKTIDGTFKLSIFTEDKKVHPLLGTLIEKINCNEYIIKHIIEH